MSRAGPSSRARWWTSNSADASAQWRSSSTSRTGRCRVSASRARRTPSKSHRRSRSARARGVPGTAGLPALGHAEQGRHLREARAGARGRGEPAQRLAERHGDRLVRDDRERIAGAEEHRRPAPVHARRERRGERGLADARLAHDHRHRLAAGLRVGPAGLQALELGAPADERPPGRGGQQRRQREPVGRLGGRGRGGRRGRRGGRAELVGLLEDGALELLELAAPARAPARRRGGGGCAGRRRAPRPAGPRGRGRA